MKLLKLNRSKKYTTTIPKQQANEWLVPFADGGACIFHGHEDRNDHSKCGPQIFCCPNAVRVLLTRYPAAIRSNAEWEFTLDTHLLTWADPLIFYFFYCHQDDSDRIYFTGVKKAELRDVLLRKVSLQEYRDVSDQIK